MADKTGISWTDATWNPTTGCDRVSPGCDNCYAMTLAKRLKGMGSAKYQTDGHPFTSGPGFGVAVHPDALDQPLRWKRPRRIFVNSMSDLFHKDIPEGFIARVFAVMAGAPQHTFQVLTKRHGRMRSLVGSGQFRDAVADALAPLITDGIPGFRSVPPWPLPNVWLGVSAEDQHWADIRIPALNRTPAAVRFVSAEPLLGPIKLHRGHGHCPVHDFPGGFCSSPCGDLILPDWLIIGGESGPGARPMQIDWARDLVRQSRAAGIAPFVKQLGAVTGIPLGAGSHGADWDAWPADLRVREFPAAAQLAAS
jgi:protein gp37